MIRSTRVRVEKKKLFLNELGREDFGLSSLCHLSDIYVQVAYFIFLSNLTVKLALGCKV